MEATWAAGVNGLLYARHEQPQTPCADSSPSTLSTSSSPGSSPPCSSSPRSSLLLSRPSWTSYRPNAMLSNSQVDIKRQGRRRNRDAAELEARLQERQDYAKALECDGVVLKARLLCQGRKLELLEAHHRGCYGNCAEGSAGSSKGGGGSASQLGGDSR